jgi:hypothetical protein
VPEQIGKAAHDREPETHATALGRPLRVVLDPVELLEDALAMCRGDADAGVDDIDRDARAAPSRADEHPPTVGVANAVGDEVADDAFEQRRVAVDREPRGDHRQRQAASGRLRGELGANARE